LVYTSLPEKISARGVQKPRRLQGAAIAWHARMLRVMQQRCARAAISRLGCALFTRQSLAEPDPVAGLPTLFGPAMSSLGDTRMDTSTRFFTSIGWLSSTNR
jgi:hypothetical protein